MFGDSCIGTVCGFAGQIQPVYIEPGLGKQMRVPSLSARHVEDTRSGGKTEKFDEPSDLSPVLAEVEDGLILKQVVGVEVRLPPFAGRARGTQKKTGSR